jgi:UDP-glucuronate 4-epimerase
MKKILVTGSAGFIGFHLVRTLLENNFLVHGIDSMTDYYDISLKNKRNEILLQNDSYTFFKCEIDNWNKFSKEAINFSPDIIVHLAAQAGVRYSIENPREYLNSNVIGSFNIMELSKKIKVKHLLMASTSSVYGANKNMPYSENHKADHQLSFYAATKKSNESMAHSYSHLWQIPTTMFRFFTVYGEYGRPDLALFKFVKAILNDEKIDIYNHGEMYRDFTYVGDLVKSIRLLIEKPPQDIKNRKKVYPNDSISPAAPFRVINIGNSNKVKLLDFIECIEKELDKKAIKNFMSMQKADVPATWADASLLENLIGYKPDTSIEVGVTKFVKWYKNFYTKHDSHN